MIILAPAIGILIGLALLVVVDIHHGAPVKEAVGFVVEVFPMVLLVLVPLVLMWAGLLYLLSLIFA